MAWMVDMLTCWTTSIPSLEIVNLINLFFLPAHMCWLPLCHCSCASMQSDPSQQFGSIAHHFWCVHHIKLNNIQFCLHHPLHFTHPMESQCVQCMISAPTCLWWLFRSRPPCPLIPQPVSSTDSWVSPKSVTQIAWFAPHETVLKLLDDSQIRFHLQATLMLRTLQNHAS